MNTKHVNYLPKPVQVRLKPELHEWVHQQAVAQERSGNWVINRVIELAREKAEQQAQGAQA